MRGPQLPPPGSVDCARAGGTAPDGPRIGRSRPGPRLAGLIGLGLLGCWVVMWAQAIQAGRFDRGEGFWVPHLEMLGGDFVSHLARPARLWAAGADPYDPNRGIWASIYPPLVHRSFTWTCLMGLEEARAVWLVAIACLAAAGTLRTVRSRAELGIGAIPPALLCASFLFSTPVVFAMERGQCDILVMPLLGGAVAALRRRTLRFDLLAGLLLAVAAYLKYYPGLVVVGLLALRRWQAVGGFVGAGVVIGLLDFRWLSRSVASMRAIVPAYLGDLKEVIHPCEHSLSGCWQPFWGYWGVDGLAGLPGKMMAPLVILPLVVVVCVRVARSGRCEALLWPLALWIVAAATFVPPIAVDYNLFFLPLAALACWDRHDPIVVHLLMAYLLLWWQPFDLGIDGSLILMFKLGGLVAVGISLCCRASERMPEAAMPVHAAETPRRRAIPV